MNKHRINLHAHTVFSDGSNSPYRMAIEAKRLGFTALVITEHWYGRRSENSLTIERFSTLKRSISEAQELLPVIIGLEVPVDGEEILVFGGDVVKNIVNAPVLPSLYEFENLKDNLHCALILCHPRTPSDRIIDLVDGFEAYNSGRDFFSNRGYGNLFKLPAWSNSDAHSVRELVQGYNGTDTKIVDERSLIAYIRSGCFPDLIYAMSVMETKR